MTQGNNYKDAKALIKDMKNNLNISNSLLIRENTRYALAIIQAEAGVNGKSKIINEFTINAFQLGVLLGMRLAPNTSDTTPEELSEDELLKICLECDHLKMKNGVLQCSAQECKSDCSPRLKSGASRDKSQAIQSDSQNIK